MVHLFVDGSPVTDVIGDGNGFAEFDTAVVPIWPFLGVAAPGPEPSGGSGVAVTPTEVTSDGGSANGIWIFVAGAGLVAVGAGTWVYVRNRRRGLLAYAESGTLTTPRDDTAARNAFDTAVLREAEIQRRLETRYASIAERLAQGLADYRAAAQQYAQGFNDVRPDAQVPHGVPAGGGNALVCGGRACGAIGPGPSTACNPSRTETTESSPSSMAHSATSAA